MARQKLISPNYTLRRNSKGIWELRWTDNGKTRTKSTQAREKREAEFKVPALMVGILTPDRPPAPTIAEICRAYESDHRQSVAAPAALSHALTPIIQRWGGLRPEQLTDRVLRDYATWRMAQVCWGGRRTTRTIGAGTVIRELNQLRPALAWAWRNKWIRDEIKFKMPVAQPAPRDRWLTKEEARTLINTGCAHAPHLKLFIRLALATAARKAAILQLTWDRVHFPSDPEPLSWVIDDDLEIEYEKFSATMLIDFGAGAGNKRRAKVPIGDNPGLYRALREAFATRCCDHVIEYREASISDVKTALAAACKRAGITACTVHTLKHTAITWMVQGNLSFTKIAGITGTSAAIIERVYGHHSPEFLAQVGDAVSI